MHVLTKIFVVLVSMLAVLLVPLVVVYAHNEDSYKSKYEQATAQAGSVRAEMTAGAARHGAEVNRLSTQLDEVSRAKADLDRARVEVEAELRRMESQIASEQGMKSEIDAKLTMLATAMKVSQDLNESLVGEVRGLRSESLTLERQKVELDEALRDVTGQLEVAVQARRALQEEIQRLRDELANSTAELAEAYAQGFQREDRGVNLGGVAPTVNLDATVISVRRSSDQTLAEIDAGSLDGVKEGWVLNIARGGSFKGKLRIINVDVNRATGVVTLQNAGQGRTVEVGDTAYARVGRD